MSRRTALKGHTKHGVYAKWMNDMRSFDLVVRDDDDMIVRIDRVYASGAFRTIWRAGNGISGAVRHVMHEFRRIQEAAQNVDMVNDGI